MVRTPLFACLLIAGLLAGCNGLGAKATIEYNGTATGTHSETGACGDSGKIDGSGKIADGQVTVRVKDSSGHVAFERTFDKDFTLDSQSLSGVSGSWTIEGQRAGNDLVGDAFNGNYKFYLYC